MYKMKISAIDIKYFGSEPSWTTDSITEENYDSEFSRGLNYYNYTASTKDCKIFLQDWFKEYGTKDQLSALSTITDRLIPTTYANTARMGMRGFPLKDIHIARIWEKTQERLKTKEDVEEEVSSIITVPVVKVKKLPENPVPIIVSAAHEAIDNIIEGETIKSISTVTSTLRVMDKQYLEAAEHIQKIANEFSELLEVRRKRVDITDDEQQLLDGYSHLTGMRVVKDIVNGLMSYVDELRKTHVSKMKVKIRKIKPLNKTKLVSRLKYLKQDAELGLTSIDPEKLLNCTEVWVYDTKYRRIGRYVSSVPGGVSVKGASITGANEIMSVGKVLRKPKEQLEEFTKSTKNGLTKWFSTVKSKSAPMRVRTTDTTIILKVFA